MTGHLEPFEVFSSTKCIVGEGPIWHPYRNELIWFDILGQAMFSSNGTVEKRWDFDFVVSAAGIVDETRLLIATENGLILFDLSDGSHEVLIRIEDDTPERRSNDGRADRQGGFWFSTMGKSAEAGAGRIYRFRRGEIRLLFKGLTIPNAICFSPDGDTAYFADTPDRRVMKVPLDRETGWPVSAPEVHVDMRENGLNPDGAIVDSKGNLWVACWGDGSVRGYDGAAAQIGRMGVATPHVSCPALGGAGNSSLFVTTATYGRSAIERLAEAPAGKTFCVEVDFQGLREAIVSI